MFLFFLLRPIRNLIRRTIDSDVKFIVGVGSLPRPRSSAILPFRQLGWSAE
jgi:hypothetical protein